MDKEVTQSDIRLSPLLVQERFWLLNEPRETGRGSRLRFDPNGAIEGEERGDLRRWEISNGILKLLNTNNTEVFVSVRVEKFGTKLTIVGQNAEAYEPTISLVEIKSSLKFNQTRESLSSNARKYGWSIGDHTYGSPTVTTAGIALLKIGKYCSIASGVTIALDNHRSDIMTTYPFKALQKYWGNVPADAEDHSTRGDVVIGNDVWIASDAFIGSGVTIGDGAIIGAKAIVTTDVAPYAVVVGNPGRIIRYRFEPDVIAEMQRLAWWELPDDTVDELLPHLLGEDIDALLGMLRSIRETASSTV